MIYAPTEGRRGMDWGTYFFALRTCRDFSSIVVVVHERRRRRGRGIDKARQ
jgi:hypothetical protein